MSPDTSGEDLRELRDIAIEIVFFNHPQTACRTQATAQGVIVD